MSLSGPLTVYTKNLIDQQTHFHIYNIIRMSKIPKVKHVHRDAVDTRCKRCNSGGLERGHGRELPE